MNISAINCTPIKPQVSFGRIVSDEERLEHISQIADSFDCESDNASNIKDPFTAIVSILLAGAFAYGSGKLLAQKSAVIAEKIHLDLPKILDNSLKTASSKIREVSSKIVKENPATKTDKLKNLAGNIIESSENLARNVYKKVAYSGVKATDDLAVKQAKAFANIGGIAGLATMFPSILSKDNDGNGVKDILQKGQNAYTGTKTRINNFSDKVGIIGNLINLYT